jgi:putative transposase
MIRLVVMMYVQYPLSLRNVEELLLERGIDICHKTVRFWWNRFGPVFAAGIRWQRVSRMREFKHWNWHHDAMYVKIDGEMHYLWRAVDQEGPKAARVRGDDHKRRPALLRRSDGRAGKWRETGDRRWANNRVENSHLSFRRRERAMLRFRQMKSLQKFASVHASFHDRFASDRQLIDRQTYKLHLSTALAEWQSLTT